MSACDPFRSGFHRQALRKYAALSKLPLAPTALHNRVKISNSGASPAKPKRILVVVQRLQRYADIRELSRSLQEEADA